MDQSEKTDYTAPLGCAIVIGVIIVCAGIFRNCGSNQSSNQRQSFPRVSEVAVLSSDSGLRIPVGSTAKALDRYIDLELADDDVGISAMRLAGLVRFIPSGTKCKVIKAGLMTYEVRLTEGDYKGQSCFVVAEFVNRE